MKNILMIDDDVSFCEMVSEYLTLEGFGVDCCYDGESGIVQATNKQYDLIILDVMLPTISGFKVLRSLTSYIDTPVIMLTASGKEIDEIIGLEIGADDYIDKPCSSRVLLSRINAVLKRRPINKDDLSRPSLRKGNLTIDFATRSVAIDESQLKLTNTEFKILERLASAPSQAHSKEELAQHSLGRSLSKHDRSLDAHINNLRKKLKQCSEDAPEIKTIHSFGFSLEL